MGVEYSKQTINHPNPIARFAHRNRHRKSISLATYILKSQTQGIIDYGCGQGDFINNLRKKGFNFAYGFEPFMKQTKKRDYIVNVMP